MLMFLNVEVIAKMCYTLQKLVCKEMLITVIHDIHLDHSKYILHCELLISIAFYSQWCGQNKSIIL
jgi:hypothetical protein